MITTFSTVEPDMIDWVRHDFDTHGQSFDYWLDKHLRAPHHYFLKGPNYLLMGWADLEQKAWIVFYSRTQNDYRVWQVIDQMPYFLPSIAFVRGLRGKKDLKYYSTKRLTKLCNTLNL